jgi:MoxR-like ATPase
MTMQAGFMNRRTRQYMTERRLEMNIEERAEQFKNAFARLQTEIGKVMVGQTDIVENTLVCFFARGHALLEGVPGLGKTMLVRTMAAACDLEFSRIQFTPDLMPADIVGTEVVHEDEAGKRVFEFRPGPIHSQIILADEINRATPKTQSAMLEAMQEATVTIGRKTYVMRQPFYVMATQNPIEMEGTYPLPEAQLDRFLLKVQINLPSKDELKEILARTTDANCPAPDKVIDAEEAEGYRVFIRELLTADNIKDYAVRLLMATHGETDYSPDIVKKYVRYGSSPRGAQALTVAAKVYAAIDGRLQVAFEDIKRAAYPALRHRILLNFEGEAEGVATDQIIAAILEHVPEIESGGVNG